MRLQRTLRYNLALMLGTVVIDSLNDTQEGIKIFKDLIIASGISTFMTCMRVAHDASLSGGGVAERFKVYGRGVASPFTAVASGVSTCCSWLSTRWDQWQTTTPEGHHMLGSTPPSLARQ